MHLKNKENRGSTDHLLGIVPLSTTAHAFKIKIQNTESNLKIVGELKVQLRNYVWGALIRN